MKRVYDETVALVAGTIAAGLAADVTAGDLNQEALAREAVKLARLIVEQVKATEEVARGSGSWTIEDDVTTDSRPPEPA
jgi:hypothetical protein